MKSLSKFFTKEALLFVALFAVLGFLALQVPVTQLMGSKAKFTLFDAFGPIASGFVGTVPGVIAVFLMQFANFLVHGAKVVDAGTIIRFFPMLFATWYFSKRSRAVLVIPVIAIVAFLAHPIGREVWYYSLFWLIPLVCHAFRERFLFARSLGATFTAHAVGGALWIYTFTLPATVWQSLIPIVALERLIFAIGISVMYVVVTNILHVLSEKKIVTLPFALNTKYIRRRSSV
ncbi:MAG: hypothetical protein HYV34_00390 [Candidatus Kerfeldbacteria bacterium]|nr:hypothetical protein [Candidatus Kerfeldbacteria bacterium]